MAEEKKVEETVAVVNRPALVKDFSIIKFVVATEQTQKLQSEQNALVLAVSKKATKTEIKAAVQSIFNAKVKSVNTINPQRKARRIGRYTGFVSQYKKAIVRFDSSFDLGKINAQVATEEMQANKEAE